MPALFQPLALRELVLANRIVVAPMCQYSADHGSASAWHHAHLGSLALSGAGLLVVEATAVSAEGRITDGCLGLYSDANEAALAPVVAMMQAVAPIALAIQLAHAGRKAASRAPWLGGKLAPTDPGGWQPVAPSALRFNVGDPLPRALSTAEVEALPAQFAQAAARAVRIGFAAIEVHMAHGYLMHQFLSPQSNHRDDAYGGPLEHRLRLPLAVFDAVRAAVPQRLPVGVRVSATDWLEHLDEPSWTVEDTIELARRLQARGCDWIDVSSGGSSPQQRIPLGPAYQVPLAQRIRAATGLTTVAVGMITAPRQAEAIVASGQADLVALAKGFLFDPRWAWRAAAELGAPVRAPAPYWKMVPKDCGLTFSEPPFGV
jgi:2,4-dienoyl-CoA reductase-like NADH-dependent reductase (Old Yellow Enzyme family)